MNNGVRLLWKEGREARGEFGGAGAYLDTVCILLRHTSQERGDGGRRGREIQESRMGVRREKGASAEIEQNEGTVQGLIINKDQKEAQGP